MSLTNRVSCRKIQMWYVIIKLEVMIINFTEKCNVIFKVLNCSNADIARSCGIDPSLISRFRTGSRQPSVKSLQFNLLCKGIVNYAQLNGLLNKLQQECEMKGLKNPEEEINDYLAENKENHQSSIKNKSPLTDRLFSEKLNVIMNKLNISNIRLARVLNIDSSLISRFRNGLRTPLKNKPMLESMCLYFYKIARQNELDQELYDLIGSNATKFENKDESIKNLVKWFSDEDDQYNAGIMDRFLEKLDNLSVFKIPDLPPLSSIIKPDTLQAQSNEYLGIDGIRQAVIRFLGTVAISQNPVIIKLYSEQSLHWLSDNPAFIQKWTALMYAVLLNKTPIKIIHNINRNLDEMLIGIEKWLPLYMSGLVEGFYRRSHSDPWFSHTLFVAPDTAAIFATHAIGTEDKGVYHYFDTPEQTAYYDKQMNNLLEHAKPLIRVFKKNRINDYLFFTGELSKAPGTLKGLPTFLSFSTIPSDLLERMLKRSNAEKDEINNLLAIHSGCVKQLDRELKNGTVTEYIVFPSDEELFAGKVALNLSNAFSERTVFYTPDEYSEHIKHLIDLLENDYYNIILLPESPYTNIQIAVKEDFGVMVQKTDNPITALWFNHPLLCKAFSEYIYAIGHKNKLSITSKQELIKYLGKYTR